MIERDKQGKGRSIRRKVTCLTFIISMAAVALSVGIGLAGMRKIMLTADASCLTVGQQAAYDSEQALVVQARQNLQEQAQERAALIGEKMSAIRSQTTVTAGFLTDIYSFPQQYEPFPVEKPSMDNAGTWALQYSLVEGVDYQEVGDEINLAGNMIHMVSSLCRNSNVIYGIYFASENGFMVSYDRDSDNMFEGKKQGEAPELFIDHMDPRNREWYLRAREEGKAGFENTYLDAFGRLMISCSAPVYDAQGRCAGVLGMDMGIDDINEAVLSSRVGIQGYTMLLDGIGDIVVAPDLHKEDGRYESVNLTDDPALGELAAQMTAGESGCMEVKNKGVSMFAAYAPVHENGWSVAMLLPKEEVVEPALRSFQSINVRTQMAADEMMKTIHVMMWGCVFAAFVVLLSVFSASGYFSNRLTRPIKQLADDAVIIGGGSLSHQVEVHTGDELEMLGNTFNQMTCSLKEYMENLSRVQADRERIATELQVATSIQASMLPCIFPAFPDRKEFDIFASMNPAKEVGGDFYDFFLTDEDHLWVVMADVSGKGVPAALFMVITKTMIKNYAGLNPSPKDVLTVVNDRLCESNEAGMFVTAFLGVLEISAGVFTYSNAGHNYPLLRQGSAAYSWLKSDPAFVLAGLPGIRYEDCQVTLKGGDCLCLYTDGVTEALNPSLELYGDDRLIRLLNEPAAAGMTPREMVEYVSQDIRTYADGAQQADDITILVLKLRDKEDHEAG